MAQYTNAYSTTQNERLRETFSNMISQIDPQETPLYSLARKESADGIHPEWSTDTLKTPSLTNAQVEGFTYSFQNINPTTRVGNYTQIFEQSWVVTKTNEVVAKAGPKSDWNREKVKAGIELRADIECTMSYNQASVAGNDSTAKKMGGLRAWIKTNDSMGSGGASGGFNTSTNIVDAATNGTQRALTKTLIDDVLEDVFQAGGDPSIVMGSPYAKRVFTAQLMNATGTSTQRTSVSNSQAKAIGAVDAYVYDFGVVSFVVNRQWTRYDLASDGGNGTGTLSRNLFVIDPQHISYKTLRPIAEDTDINTNADAKPGQLVHEGCLAITNEKALGVVADIYGLTSAS